MLDPVLGAERFLGRVRVLVGGKDARGVLGVDVLRPEVDLARRPFLRRVAEYLPNLRTHVEGAGQRAVGRLAIHDRGQVLDGRALDELARPQLLLGLLACRHVEQQTLPGSLLARVRLQEGRFFLDPHVGTVCAPEAVLDRVRPMGATRLDVQGEDAFAIVGVEPVGPEVVRPGPFVDRVPQDPLHLRTEEELRGILVVGLAVDDRGDVLDQRLEALARQLELLFGLAPLGDVDHHALPRDGRAVDPADQLRLVVEPHDAAVRGAHPVLAAVRVVELGGARVPLDPREILGFGDARPEAGLGPSLDRIAEELLDLWAHVVHRGVLGECVVGGQLLVGDHGRVLDDLAVALLGDRDPLRRLDPLGDVGEEALPVRRLVVLAADQLRLVVDPQRRAVTGEHPVVHRERVPGRVDPFVLGDERGAVVGVDHGGPVGDVAEEGLGTAGRRAARTGGSGSRSRPPGASRV